MLLACTARAAVGSPNATAQCMADCDPRYAWQGIWRDGGYITGSAALIDFLRCCATGFIYTTSLPPALAAGALASVRHLRSSNIERGRHQERAATVRWRLL